MQGIQLFEYKSLQECLQKLQQEEYFNVPCEHADQITQHEEKLKEIYDHYQHAVKQVSVIISQFEEHKRSIRRLISHHRSCRRSLSEKKIGSDKFQLP